jgi:selenophosphate synthase
MPTCSQFLNLASSSWRYSLRRARERPAQYVSACFQEVDQLDPCVGLSMVGIVHERRLA